MTPSFNNPGLQSLSITYIIVKQYILVNYNHWQC